MFGVNIAGNQPHANTKLIITLAFDRLIHAVSDEISRTRYGIIRSDKIHSNFHAWTKPTNDEFVGLISLEKLSSQLEISIKIQAAFPQQKLPSRKPGGAAEGNIRKLSLAPI